MSEQEELATGGVIENAPLMDSEMQGEEFVTMPATGLTNCGLPSPGWIYNPLLHGTIAGTAAVMPNPTLCNPGGPMLSVGWNSGAGYQQPVYQPTNTFPTLAELKAFVKRCVDERLDELAQEMRDKALQPGTWRK